MQWKFSDSYEPGSKVNWLAYNTPASMIGQKSDIFSHDGCKPKVVREMAENTRPKMARGSRPPKQKLSLREVDHGQEVPVTLFGAKFLQFRRSLPYSPSYLVFETLCNASPFEETLRRSIRPRPGEI
jgi:hypothetical protein